MSPSRARRPGGGLDPAASLDPTRCTACGLCSRVCVPGAAAPGVDGKPVFDGGACIGCGHCAAVCPVDAFGIGTVPGDPAAGGLLGLARSRRSVRFFTGEAVSPGDLGSLLEVVGYSPTGVNACGIRVVAVEGAATVREKLHEPLRRVISFLWRTGPLRLAGLLSRRSGMAGRAAGGEDLVFRGAPLVLFFFVPRRNPTWRSDGVIAATLVMLRAAEMGLGCFWNGIAEALYPLFGAWRLPGAEGCRLAAVLCLGRPALEYRCLPPRGWELVQAPPAGES